MVAKPNATPKPQLTRTGQGRDSRARKGPHGYGAMRDVPLDIDPRIDLTEPIYEQARALEQADKNAAGRDKVG